MLNPLRGRGVLTAASSLPESTRPPVPTRSAALVGLALGLAAALVGVRIGALGGGPVLSMMLLAVAALIALLSVGAGGMLRTRIGALDAAFLLYIVVRTAAEAWNASELQHSAYAGITLDPAMYYLAFLAARWVTESDENLIGLLRGLTAPVFFVAPLAIAQVLRVPGVGEFILANVSAGGFERRFGLNYELRGTATIGHHTAMGGYLLVLAAIACTDLLLTRSRGRWSSYPLVVLGLAILGQVTTLTFATIGATAVVILLTLLKLGIRPGILVASFVAMALAWGVFGSSVESRVEDQTIRKSDEFGWLPSTVAFRMEVWINETIPAIAHRPFTGWGSDVYSAAEKDWPITPSELVWISPESEYLRTLIAGGWVSLIAEAFLLLVVLVALIRASRRLSGGIAVPAITVFAVLLIISTMHSHLSNPGVPYLLWPLIGAILGARIESESPAHVQRVATPSVPQPTSDRRAVS